MARAFFVDRELEDSDRCAECVLERIAQRVGRGEEIPSYELHEIAKRPRT